MKQTTFTLLLFCIFTSVFSQSKLLISKDSTKVTYTILNNNIINAKKTSFTIGLVFAEFRYFKYNKYVIGLLASAYSGFRAGISYCYKTSSQKKPAKIYLGKNYDQNDKIILYYANDSVINNKMSCVHVGAMYGPLLFTTGTFLQSPGLQLGIVRYKLMINKCKAKSRDFFSTSEKTVRKSIHADLMYFPTFAYKKINLDDRSSTLITDKNIFGLLVGYTGSNIRRVDPRQHQVGLGWRLGFGITFNGHVFADAGIGFSF
jgi:hypothetical protein